MNTNTMMNIGDEAARRRLILALGTREIREDPVVAVAGRDNAGTGRKPRGGGCGLEHARALSS